MYSEQASKLWNVNPLPSYDLLKENDENTTKYPLYFMSPNSKNRIHSQFNNLNVIKLLSPEPFVTLHPDDATIRGIKDGDNLKIYNDRGYIKTKAKLDYSIKKGCVAMTNGWWIQEGGTTNFLSKGRETDMGYGTAFHDNKVEIKKLNGTS